jgi:hypothetical protein
VLTHFPYGLSYFLAAFVFFNVPIVIALKIYGLLFTFVGWFGWIIFVNHIIKYNYPENKYIKWILLVISFSLPIFTTPGWYGTDIVPWALAPWILVALFKAIHCANSKSPFFVFLAGAGSGVAVVFRYGGIVLLAFGGLIVFLAYFDSFRLMIRRGVLYCLGASPFLVLQFYYIFVLAPKGSSVGGISPTINFEILAGKTADAFQQIPAINNTLLFWLPDRLKLLVVGGWSNLTGEWAIVSYVITLIIFLFPVIVFFSGKFQNIYYAVRNPIFLASILIPVTGLFLLACTIQGTWSYAGDRRYYLPLIPLASFVCLFTSISAKPVSGLFCRVVHFLATFLSVGLAASMLLYFVFLFLPGPYGAVARGKAEISIPKFKPLGFSYEKYKSREYAFDWIRNYPDSHVLTNFIDFFIVDPNLNQSRIHRIPSQDQIEGKTVVGPMLVLIVAIDQGDGLLHTVDPYGNVKPVPCLLKLPNLKKLASFDEKIYPTERISIYEAFIGEGEIVKF